MSLRLVLWRHGQTDWNVTGTYQGQHDIALNERGLAQAREAAPVLAGFGPSRIVASPLSRADTTARTLAELTGLQVDHDDRLTEINVGSWVGYDWDRACAEDPQFPVAVREGRDHRRSEMGETAGEVGVRVGSALRDIAASAGKGDTVVVVSHGLAIRMGACDLLGWDFRTSLQLAAPGNCAWGILQPTRDHGWRIATWNTQVGGTGQQAHSI